MSEDDKRRAIVLRRVACGSLSLSQASRLLQLSYRQTKRVWQRWREEGDEGLAHRNRGRPSNRSFPEKFRRDILQKYEEQCSGLGPTEFARHLAENGIDIDHETLRRWMLKDGAWTLNPCSQVEQKRKNDKLGFGQVVTLASVHGGWLGGRSQSYLYCIYDHATSVCMFSIAAEETAAEAMRILWNWIDRYGIPAAVHCQRQFMCVKNWRPTLEEQLSGVEPKTPFFCACERLGIEARSLGASELRGFLEEARPVLKALETELSNLRSPALHTANHQLRVRITRRINEQYSDLSEKEDFHVKIVDGTDLRSIFCFKREYSLGRDHTLEVDRRLYRIKARYTGGPSLARRVTVSRWIDGSLHVYSGGREMGFEEVTHEQSCALNESAM